MAKKRVRKEKGIERWLLCLSNKFNEGSIFSKQLSFMDNEIEILFLSKKDALVYKEAEHLDIYEPVKVYINQG